MSWTVEEERERIPILQKAIREWRAKFHAGEEVGIPEGALDALKHELHELEQHHPDLITPDSPTQTVL